MQSRTFVRRIAIVAGLLVAAILVSIIGVTLVSIYSRPTIPVVPDMPPPPLRLPPIVKTPVPPSAMLGSEPALTNAAIRDNSVAGGPRTDLPGAPKIVAPDLKVLKRITPPKTVRVAPGIRREGATNQVPSFATFRTYPERLLSQLLRMRPGETVPLQIPIMKDFDRDFAASLQNMIEIYETDTPEEEQHKINVAWMKDELRKRLEAGESPAKIVNEYRTQMNELAALRLDLQRQLGELKKADRMEEAEQFVADANELLEQYGARPLVLTPNRKPPK